MDFFESAFLIIMVGRAVLGIGMGIWDNPLKKVKAIEERQRQGCYTIAKVSSYTLTGTYKKYLKNIEYVYKVNGKLYYITYEINMDLVDTDSKKKLITSGPLKRFFKQDEINEAELMSLSDTMCVYYDGKNPAKVITKQEAFIAECGLRRVKTKKENPYRNIEADWVDPVDLRQPDKERM